MVDPWLTNDPLWPLAEKTPEKPRELVTLITHADFDHASGIDEIVVQNNKVFINALSLFERGIENIVPTGVGAINIPRSRACIFLWDCLLTLDSKESAWYP